MRCPRPFVSQLENGLRPQRSRSAERIAAHLGLEVDELAEPATITPAARDMLDSLAVAP